MTAPARLRVAVYGEIDPNLVDGSSVWLQSICQVLGSLDDVGVTLLLRRPVEPDRRFLLGELEAAGSIELVDSGRPRLLGPVEALDLLEELDRERGPFDLLLLRGQAVLAEAAGRDSFHGRLWPYAMTGRGMPDETLRALAVRSARVLCQTETVAEELREIVPGADGSLLVLPPMIPDSSLPPGQDGGDGGLRLAYSGKLAPEYCWLETVEAFRGLRESQPEAELHVLGDKVHRPPHLPNFHEEAMRSLRETEGLRWHGGVSRSEVHGLLAKCDLALSIRDPGVEGAREISTKVLEYGAASPSSSTGRRFTRTCWARPIRFSSRGRRTLGRSSPARPWTPRRAPPPQRPATLPAASSPSPASRRACPSTCRVASWRRPS
jgi:glycosyltransferase involved in cell wall biosynthesis